MQNSVSQERKDWRHRPLTRTFVFALAWWHVACYAIDFPSVPLQTGATQPAPNVIFILDDSLSMEGNQLDSGLTWTNETPGIGSNAYTKNPLAYNPKITYKPWATANDHDTAVERLANAVYTKVCGDASLLTSCSVDLSSSAQTFYVPKSDATKADQRTYYRYQILAGGNKLVRAEWGTGSGGSNSSLGCTGTGTGGRWRNCQDISDTGDPARGVRRLAEEKQNYANWYQYHRTRMKAAKAGGSEAFASLDENFRMGIMGLYPTGVRQQVINGSVTAAAPNPSNDDPGNLKDIIPVDSNGGLFIGKNRKDWFDFLHKMDGRYVTPLRQALDAAGKYFSTSRAYRATTDGVTTYLACRQNFAILTTDGYWNNLFGEDPDSRYTALSGDEEMGQVIQGPNGQKYQYVPAPPYWYAKDDAKYGDDTSLADVAMHYWKTDLLTKDVTGYPGSAENRVPFSVANPAFWQHMVTFGVGFGVKGLLSDAEVQAAMQGTGYWPKPKHTQNGGDEPPENVDDLRHAALNGRGSYVDARDPETFAKGVADALNRIGERRGSASNVLANSTSITTESFVYQATYTAGAWRGELLAYPISAAGLGAPDWRASEGIPAWNTRKIFTFSGGGGTTFPSPGQISDLSAPASKLGVSATALANYLKGDGSNEKRNSGVLRDRLMRDSSDQLMPALLGDIVDSTPHYSADIQTIFVGANDGMLHAFDASTSGNAGKELFTYIPRGVKMERLAELADPLYGTNENTRPHRYFVDGPIVVSARSRTPGKNYLVGAMGRGGRGVFALDVTNPGSFDATKVMWDLTGDAAPANMGNVISEPLISKLNNGATAAVVANGPNSGSGTASLFLLRLTDGSVIAELDTHTANNGLSSPRAVDVNADGIADYFFAGDLRGNLWRFDVSAGDPGDWTVEKVFTATTKDGKAQSITGGLAVARNPSTGDIWVFFGTGRYITSDDQKNKDIQSFYAIIVGQHAADNENLTRADLLERHIYLVDQSTGYRSFDLPQTAIGSDYEGWFIDLDKPTGTGERVISSPLIYDTVLIFSSVIPPQQEKVNSCDAGGSGYVNALNAFTGASLTNSFFDLPIHTLMDGDGNAVAVGSLPVGTGMPTAPVLIGDKLVVGDSSGGTPTAFDVNRAGGNMPRRVSWREIFNID
jgi:type IV pilus assembly protein PilY1